MGQKSEAVAELVETMLETERIRAGLPLVPGLTGLVNALGKIVWSGLSAGVGDRRALSYRSVRSSLEHGLERAGDPPAQVVALATGA